jgi:hypothetical protein
VHLDGVAGAEVRYVAEGDGIEIIENIHSCFPAGATGRPLISRPWGRGVDIPLA